MKMKAVISTSFIILFLFAGCKKDNEIIPHLPSPPNEVIYPDFSQLKVGNYWVYQQFIVDSSGNATPTNVYDSCYVEKDTLINNNTYFKVYRPNPYFPQWGYTYLRDSLHYIVSCRNFQNQSSQICFSSQDFNTTFYSYHMTYGNLQDTIALVTAKMEYPGLIVSTPAGSFETSTFKINYNYGANWDNFGNPRHQNTRYSKGVGIVSEELPHTYSNPNYLERRLVRYHVN